MEEDRRLGSFVTEDCRIFFRHWLALPRRDRIPLSRDFLDNPPIGQMPSVIILEVMAAGIFCRFMGTEVVRTWQCDLTGQLLDEQAFSWGAKSGTSALRRIIAQPCGLHRTATIKMTSGRASEYEVVQLPLGVDSGRPSRIVAYGRPLDLRIKNLQNRDYARSGESDTFRWLDIGAGVPQAQP